MQTRSVNSKFRPFLIFDKNRPLLPVGLTIFLEPQTEGPFPFISDSGFRMRTVSNTEVWDLMTLSSLDTSPLFRTLTVLYYSMIVVSCSVHVLRLQDTF